MCKLLRSIRIWTKLNRKCSSPVRIKGSAHYYLRVRVPADVVKTAKDTTIAVPVGTKVERVKITNWVKVSLRTKDVTEAKRRFVDAHKALEGCTLKVTLQT